MGTKRILQFIWLLVMILGITSCFVGRKVSRETLEVTDAAKVQEEVILPEVVEEEEIAYEMEETGVISPEGEDPVPVLGLPPMVIYKTRNDYRMQVPVTLNETRTAIESFPSPGDVYYQGELAIPVQLEQGYLLDNRGIGLHTAFLSLTYEQYSKLKEVPSAQDLFDMILDKDPLLELYMCGNRLGEEHDVFIANALITTGSIRECNKLK